MVNICIPADHCRYRQLMLDILEKYPASVIVFVNKKTADMVAKDLSCAGVRIFPVSQPTQNF